MSHRRSKVKRRSSPRRCPKFPKPVTKRAGID
jgi:hypothetical protein